MKDTIAKIEQMCKICRETNAGDDQYILTRLVDLETLIDLAKKGLVFTEMIETWAKMTKDEKDKAEAERKEQQESEVDDAIELLKEQTPRKETFWDSLSEAELMEPMRHFND